MKIGISDEELVRLIGARLVEVEGVIDETHKYLEFLHEIKAIMEQDEWLFKRFLLIDTSGDG